VDATRDWSRTWRIPLVTDLGVLLGCFVAFHVPGQTARFRGFTKGDKQNGPENCPITFELHSCHSIAGPTGKSCLFLLRSALCHVGDLHSIYVHNGQAKAKATANKVTATKIGAQIPSDNTDKAISGNSLSRGATLVAKRLYRDFPRYVLMPPRHSAIPAAVREGNGPIA